MGIDFSDTGETGLLETKGLLRRVRTMAGALRFGVPINSTIVADKPAKGGSRSAPKPPVSTPKPRAPRAATKPGPASGVTKGGGGFLMDGERRLSFTGSRSGTMGDHGLYQNGRSIGYLTVLKNGVEITTANKRNWLLSSILAKNPEDALVAIKRAREVKPTITRIGKQLEAAGQGWSSHSGVLRHRSSNGALMVRPTDSSMTHWVVSDDVDSPGYVAPTFKGKNTISTPIPTSQLRATLAKLNVGPNA